MAVLGDREIGIKKLNETQMMLIMREGAVLRSPHVDTARRMKGVAMILDIVESAIEDGDDLEYVTKLVSLGKVEFPELLSLVVPEGEGTAPKAPVRRAPRKR